MEAYFYKPVFINLVLILSISRIFSFKNKINYAQTRNNINITYFLGFLLFIFLGTRPVSGVFVDMTNYATLYKNIESVNYPTFPESDWIFYQLITFCRNFTVDNSIFFLLCSLCYVMSYVYYSLKTFREYSIDAFLMIISSLMFFAYGTNGIRQGMACALILPAIYNCEIRNYYLGALLGYVAYGLHSSVLIIVISYLLVSKYKNIRLYTIIWMACIVISYIFGDITDYVFGNFAHIITDKDSSYLSNEGIDMSVFSVIGFRYDFILYSSVPVILANFYSYRKMTDLTYEKLSCMYIFCNSLWVLVNQSWLTSRIGYLSWFIYPLILIYPVLKSGIYKNKKFYYVVSVLGSISFSYAMWIINKYP